jgi:hypothetical protein
MKFIDDWRRNWHRLWSMRLLILAASLQAAIELLPYFADVIPPKPFGILSLFLTVAAGIARLVQQPALKENQDAAAKQ